MAKEATKTALSMEHPPEPVEPFVSHSDIAALAFQLWEDRGCPDGSPEEDWFKAEQQLSTRTK
jgi:hypothetical protein